MRFDVRWLGVSLSIMTAGATFAACGSEVSTATGGGGAGAGGTSTTTDTTTVTTSTTMTTSSSSSSSSSSGTTSSSSSSSSGGGNACTQECALVQQCFGFDGCAQFGIDCNNPAPQAQCLIDCIGQGNPTCNNIQQVATACFGVCQNVTDGGPPPPMDGGPGGDCQGCAIGQCQGAAFACAQNQACMGWLGCVGQCEQSSNPGCPAACDMQFAAAKPLFDSLYACTCNNCAMECGALDPCAHVP